MKILELRFKNLNSLYGEWLIDFQTTEYVTEGIFLLTGPIGSGKSTVLDAICLALYGVTPRLGNISSTTNEIMSRQTTECYAEVVFEVNGTLYRCRWSQHKSRHKLTGDLQPPEHEISFAESGKIIETKSKKTLARVKELSGMDFNQFTKSILLAQGGFDQFLKAASPEKSEILEKITGTEIYTLISKNIFERHKKEKTDLEYLQKELDNIHCLESEQEEMLRAEIDEKQKEELRLNEQLDQIKEGVTWLERLEELKRELQKAESEKTALLAKQEKFAPERKRLQQAVIAATLDGPYANLITVRREQNEDLNLLKATTEKLPIHQAQWEQSLKELTLAEKTLKKTEEDQKAIWPLIQEIKLLDQSLKEKKDLLDQRQNAINLINKDLHQYQQQRDRKVKERQAEQDKLAVIDTYLEENEMDRWLVTGFSGLNTDLEHLVSRQNDLNINEKEMSNYTAEEQEKALSYERACAVLKEKEDDQTITESLQQKREELNDILKGHSIYEYTLKKETLLREKAFHQVIAKLEDYRQQLEDDKPCPLCGSADHPYAAGNIPTPDETEKEILIYDDLLTRANACDKSIKELEFFCNQQEKEIQKCRQDKETAFVLHREAKRALANAVERRDLLRMDYEIRKNEILKKLQLLGINELIDTEITKISLSLKERFKQWVAKSESKTELQKRIAFIEESIKTIDVSLQLQTDNLSSQQIELEKIQEEYGVMAEKRREKFDTKDPTQVEQQWNESVSKARKNQTEAQTAHNKAESEKNNTQTVINTTQKRIDLHAASLTEQEEKFREKLQKAGFADQSAFEASRLEQKERERIQEEATVLDTEQSKLEGRYVQLEKQRTSETQKAVTDRTKEELTSKSIELREQIKKNGEELVEKQSILRNNEENQKLFREKQESLNVQKKIVEQWGVLNTLIGSSSGHKYRNYAQGLTFDRVIYHANQQLKDMNDRYFLIRQKDTLELNVQDWYQAGEVRPTSNLSGGERFLISLALALGLSRTAGQNTQMDSLFLDEGFGTLDEDTLETVIDALVKDQQKGKLVGIISHVSKSQDFIRTKILVNQVSGGRSLLTGPGVKQV